MMCFKWSWSSNQEKPRPANLSLPGPACPPWATHTAHPESPWPRIPLGSLALRTQKSPMEAKETTNRSLESVDGFTTQGLITTSSRQAALFLHLLFTWGIWGLIKLMQERLIKKKRRRNSYKSIAAQWLPYAGRVGRARILIIGINRALAKGRLSKINPASPLVFVSFLCFPVASSVSSAGEQGSFLNNSAHLQTQSSAEPVLGSQYFRAVFTQRGQLHSNQNLMGHPRGGSLEAEKECSLIRNARIGFSPSQQATWDCGLYRIIEEILCQQLPGKEAWPWQDTGPYSSPSARRWEESMVTLMLYLGPTQACHRMVCCMVKLMPNKTRDGKYSEACSELK